MSSSKSSELDLLANQIYKILSSDIQLVDRIQQSSLQKIDSIIQIVFNKLGQSISDKQVNELVHAYLKSNNELKICAFILIMKMAVEQGKVIKANIFKYIPTYMKTIKKIKNINVGKIFADFYAYILKNFTTGLYSTIEEHVQQLLIEISDNYINLYEEKTTILMVLIEVLKLRPYILFKELREIQLYLFLKNISIEQIENLTFQLNFLFILIKELSKLEIEDQRNLISFSLNKLIKDCKDNVNLLKDNSLIILILFLTEIFNNLSLTFFNEEEYQSIVETINSILLKSELAKNETLIPYELNLIIAEIKFNPLLFYKQYLTDVFDHLMMLVDQASYNIRDKIFVCFASIFKQYKNQLIMNFLKNTLTKLLDIFEKDLNDQSGQDSIQDGAMNCLIRIIKCLKTIHYGQEARVNSLIDIILIKYFDMKAIEIMELLHNSDDLNFNLALELKMRYCVVFLLKQNQRNSDNCLKDLDEFKKDLTFEEDFLTIQADKIKNDFAKAVQSKRTINEDDTEQSEISFNAKVRPINDEKKEGLQPSYFEVNRKQINSDFMIKLERYYKSNKSNIQISDEQISIALEALGKFDFVKSLTSHRLAFIKEMVLEYLSCDNAGLRSQAAKIVLQLQFGEDKSEFTNSNYNTSIQNIIARMISIAQNDPDTSVRINTLIALNSNSGKKYISCITSQENMQILIDLASDSNEHVRKQAIIYLLKTIPIVPELINKIDQMLFLAISILNSSINLNLQSNEEVTQIKLIIILIKYARPLMENKLTIIAQILMEIFNKFIHSLCDQEFADIEILGVIMKALYRAIQGDVWLSQKYFEEISLIFYKHITRLSENNAYNFYKLMIQIIRWSNFQIILVAKFEIFELLFFLLEKNQSTKNRTIILKIISAIGAIDPLAIIKFATLRKKGVITIKTSKEEIIQILSKIRKQPFFLEYIQSQQPKDNREQLLKTEFDQFRHHILLSNHNGVIIKSNLESNNTQLDKKSAQKNDLQNENDTNTYHNVLQHSSHSSSVSFDPFVLYGKKQSMQNENKVLRIKYKQKSNSMSSEEGLLLFVNQEIIKIIINQIETTKNNDFNLICLETLENIIYALGKHSSNYLDIIFYSIINSFNQNNQHSKINLIKNKYLSILKVLILAAGSQFQKDNEIVDEMIKVVVINISNKELREILLDICEILIDYKICIKYRFKEVVSVLLDILIVQTKNQVDAGDDVSEDYNKIFKVLLRLDDNEYLELITPVFLKLPTLFESQNLKNIKLKYRLVELATEYFRSIKKTSHFLHLAGNIIRLFISLKEIIPEQQSQIQDFLFEITLSLKYKSLNYLNLIIPHMQNHQPFYDYIEELEENNFIFPVQTSQVSNQQLNFNQKEDQIKIESENGESKSSFLELFYRKSDFKPIREAFFIFNLGKSVSWEDWLQRVTIELINQSPSFVLASCKPLIYFPEITKSLFKSSFLSLWPKLSDDQKRQLSQGFNSLFSFSLKIPLRIRQEIIDLVEIMTKEELPGFILSSRKLADFVLKCHNIHRAIFFKEQEFQTDPLSAIDSLLKLYSEVGLKTASEGLVEYAQKNLGLTLQVSWLKSMGHWERIHQEEKDSAHEDHELQILCNLELSNWEWSLKRIEELLNINEAKDKANSGIPETDGLQKKLKAYGAKASFHLAKWDDLSQYIEAGQDDRGLYEGAITISQGKFKEAEEYVEQAFKQIEKESISFGSYSTTYEKLVNLQLLNEMSEILELRKMENNLINNDLYKFLVPDQDAKKKISENRKHILGLWKDRLNIMESNISSFQKVLAVRSLFCEETELLPSRLKFAKLCFKQENTILYTDTINKLRNIQFLNQSDKDQILLAKVECDYKTGRLQQLQVIGLIEEISDKKGISKENKPLLYTKLGIWLIKSEIIVEQKYKKVVEFLDKAVGQIRQKPKVWHYYALANFYLYQELIESQEDNDLNNEKVAILKKTIESFAKAISLDNSNNGKYTIQDLLRFLDLWYDYHDCGNSEIRLLLENSIDQIRNKDWILIYGPILARVELKESFTSSARKILTSLAREYPQTLIFPLLVAKRSNVSVRSRLANRIILSHQDTHSKLINEAKLFADELIRVSVLFEEQWYHGFGEASRYKQEGNMQMVLYVLNTLFNNTTKNINKPTLSETAFFHHYGYILKRAEELLITYHETDDEICFTLAWDILSNFYKQLDAAFKQKNGNIYLENVSPNLLEFKNSILIVPGINKLYSLKQKEIYIESIDPILKYLNSKRKPRKISLFGSDGKRYSFLLKGNEDLRQDERVMQLLVLMNELLKNSRNFDHHSMRITTFNVLPLSYNCGLISWLENCDPIFELVKQQREQNGISANCEKKLVSTICENYDLLPKTKKLEVYMQVQEHTRAEELKKILWIQSKSAENWLTRRHSFISSCAVMSVIGYILGLGDRHLMNIMLEKTSGKIVHIDFGDCFETASMREKLPEKIPFRLTRLLTNAMEVCGTEGTFQSTCEKVMNVMRENKEVILALLEEFICDPIISWRLGNETFSNCSSGDSHTKSVYTNAIDKSQQTHIMDESFKKEGIVETEIKIRLKQNRGKPAKQL